MSRINPPAWAKPTEFIAEATADSEEDNSAAAEAQKKLKPRMPEILQIVEQQVNLYVNDEQLTGQDEGFPARDALAGTYFLSSMMFNAVSEFWLVHVLVYAQGVGPRGNYLSLDVSVSCNRQTGELGFWSVNSAAI